MSLQDIGLGTVPGDKTGDPARTAGQKINANFQFLDQKINGISTTPGSNAQRLRAVINIVDNTQPPPTEIEGNRYILDFTTGGVHADWDGASAGDVVEFIDGFWAATIPEEGMVAYIDDLDVDYRFVNDGTPAWEVVSSNTDGASQYITPTVYTSDSESFDGSQHGISNIYEFNGQNPQELIIDEAAYDVNKVCMAQRGEQPLELKGLSGAPLGGKRNSENRTFLRDPNSHAFFRKNANGKIIVDGNIELGYTGAVQVTSYSSLRESQTGVELIIVGSGFSLNTKVSFSTGITLNNIVSANQEQMVINVDVTALQDALITVTFDNGDITVDTNAITILAPISIPLQNLVWYSRFNDNANDEVGALNGALQANTNFLPGKSGNGVVLAGGTKYVSVVDDNIFSFGDGNTDTPFSFVFSVYFNSLGESYIVNKRGTSDNIEYQIFLNSSNKLDVLLFDQSEGSQIRVNTGDFVFAIETWYTITVAYDGSSNVSGISVNINDSDIPLTDASSGTYTAMENGSSPFVIGSKAHTLGQDGVDGIIDTLGLFNKALTASEKTNVFNLIDAGNELI